MKFELGKTTNALSARRRASSSYDKTATERVLLSRLSINLTKKGKHFS